MEYIDSSVFIGAFLPTDPNHKICRSVIDTMIRDRLPAATPVFGLAEIGGFFTRNISEKVGLKHVTTLQRIENLQIHYSEDFYTFMDSVLAILVSTGLPGADAIHFVSAISLLEVDEIVTLDRHFRRMEDQIKVTILRGYVITGLWGLVNVFGSWQGWEPPQGSGWYDRLIDRCVSQQCVALPEAGYIGHSGMETPT